MRGRQQAGLATAGLCPHLQGRTGTSLDADRSDISAIYKLLLPLAVRGWREYYSGILVHVVDFVRESGRDRRNSRDCALCLAHSAVAEDRR